MRQLSTWAPAEQVAEHITQHNTKQHPTACPLRPNAHHCFCRVRKYLNDFENGVAVLSFLSPHHHTTHLQHVGLDLHAILQASHALHVFIQLQCHNHHSLSSTQVLGGNIYLFFTHRVHKNSEWQNSTLHPDQITKQQINSQKQWKMKEKDLSCFGLVFTACSVLGRLCWLDKRDFPENVHTACPC